MPLFLSFSLSSHQFSLLFAVCSLLDSCSCQCFSVIFWMTTSFFFFCLFRSLTVLADRFSAFVMKIKLNRMIWCVLNWSNQSQSHSDACIIRAVCFNNSINRTTSPPRENPNKHYDMQTGKIIRQTFFHAISLWNIVVHILYTLHTTLVYITGTYLFVFIFPLEKWFRLNTGSEEKLHTFIWPACITDAFYSRQHNSFI